MSVSRPILQEKYTVVMSKYMGVRAFCFYSKISCYHTILSSCTLCVAIVFQVILVPVHVQNELVWSDVSFAINLDDCFKQLVFFRNRCILASTHT